LHGLCAGVEAQWAPIGDGSHHRAAICRVARRWPATGCGGASSGGNPISLLETRAPLFPNPRNPDFVRLRVNCRWGLPKEDFLYYIATGHAGMGRRGQRGDPRASPSCTRQEPYVQAIVELLGGADMPEIWAIQGR